MPGVTVPGRNALFGLSLCSLLIGLALAIQSQLGVATHEFTSDELAHYITAVALRNLILSGHLLSPIAFLTNFYGHYQFLGIGAWPPGYHLLAAAWGAVFGLGRASVMAFQGCLGAALAATGALAARRALGPWLAIVVGVGILVTPLTLAALAGLQADLPTALFMLFAALAFARLLQRERVRDGLLFGLAALAAIMVKGNALALGLLPPLAVILTGRWGLVLRAGFWVPGAVILPIAVPWYGLTYSWASAGFRYTFGQAYSTAAAAFIGEQILAVFGPVLLLFIAVAVLNVLGRRQSDDGFSATMFALVLSTAIFQALVPAALEPRYLLPIVAPMLLLAARGAQLSMRVISDLGARRLIAPAVLATGILAMVLGARAALPTRIEVGARPLADAVRRLLPASDPVVLIASDAAGEGALSSELAMADAIDPRIIAARGVRVLGGGGYNNFQYQPRFSVAEQALAFVDSLRIPLIVLDRSEAAGKWAHNRQLATVLDRPGNGWVKVTSVKGGGRTYDLYTRHASEGATRREALAEFLRPRKTLPTGSP